MSLDSLSGAEVFAVSQTGYTNKKIALSWLDHFIKYVGAGPDAKHWPILLLDGHLTHKMSLVSSLMRTRLFPSNFPLILRMSYSH